MRCERCGRELPDNAAFCSSCGNRIAEQQPAQAFPYAQYGAGTYVPQQPAQPKQMPPVFKTLLDQVKAFFTKKDPVGTVANAAQDKSWSGAILIGLTVLLCALSKMVYVLEMPSYLFLGEAAGKVFLLSLIMGCVYAGAAALMTFVVLKYMYKNETSIQACLNIVAYAAIPMLVAYVLNMLLGLIWSVLPVFTLLVAIVATMLLIYSAVSRAYALERPPFAGAVIIVAIEIILFYIPIPMLISNLFRF